MHSHTLLHHRAKNGELGPTTDFLDPIFPGRGDPSKVQRRKNRVAESYHSCIVRFSCRIALFAWVKKRAEQHHHGACVANSIPLPAVGELQYRYASFSVATHARQLEQTLAPQDTDFE